MSLSGVDVNKDMFFFGLLNSKTVMVYTYVSILHLTLAPLMFHLHCHTGSVYMFFIKHSLQ